MAMHDPTAIRIQPRAAAAQTGKLGKLLDAVNTLPLETESP